MSMPRAPRRGRPSTRAGDAPSPRQLAVLKVIVRRTAKDGAPPTIRTMMDELDISSTNGVFDHLRALSRKGLITHIERRARTVKVTRTARRFLEDA